MGLEYHTVKFANDAQGVAQKNSYTHQMTAQGWRIASEVIEQGHIKGEEACCGFMICAPLAFLAGRTPATIVTTFAREISSCASCGARLPADALFCRNCGGALSGAKPTVGSNACPKCGRHVSAEAAFCSQCGSPIQPALPGKPIE
jgi:ribosomal protein L40E